MPNRIAARSGHRAPAVLRSIYRFHVPNLGQRGAVVRLRESLRTRSGLVLMSADRESRWVVLSGLAGCESRVRGFLAELGFAAEDPAPVDHELPAAIDP